MQLFKKELSRRREDKDQVYKWIEESIYEHFFTRRHNCTFEQRDNISSFSKIKLKQRIMHEQT